MAPDTYYVCGKCAHTWCAPEADRCENCGAHSSWLDQFPTLDDAEDVSEALATRRILDAS